MRTTPRFWTNLFAKLGYRPRKRKGAMRPTGRRLQFQALEDRQMMSANVSDMRIDGLTSGSTVAFTVSLDASSGGSTVVEFDHNGDGYPDGSVYANGSGSYSHDPRGGMIPLAAEGPVTLSYRTAFFAEYGPPAYGDCQDYNFTLEGSGEGAASATGNGTGSGQRVGVETSGTGSGAGSTSATGSGTGAGSTEDTDASRAAYLAMWEAQQRNIGAGDGGATEASSGIDESRAAYLAMWEAQQQSDSAGYGGMEATDASRADALAMWEAQERNIADGYGGATESSSGIDESRAAYVAMWEAQQQSDSAGYGGAAEASSGIDESRAAYLAMWEARQQSDSAGYGGATEASSGPDESRAAYLAMWEAQQQSDSAGYGGAANVTGSADEYAALREMYLQNSDNHSAGTADSDSSRADYLAMWEAQQRSIAAGYGGAADAFSGSAANGYSGAWNGSVDYGSPDYGSLDYGSLGSGSGATSATGSGTGSATESATSDSAMQDMYGDSYLAMMLAAAQNGSAQADTGSAGGTTSATGSGTGSATEIATSDGDSAMQAMYGDSYMAMMLAAAQNGSGSGSGTTSATGSGTVAGSAEDTDASRAAYWAMWEAQQQSSIGAGDGGATEASGDDAHGGPTDAYGGVAQGYEGNADQDAGADVYVAPSDPNAGMEEAGDSGFGAGSGPASSSASGPDSESASNQGNVSDPPLVYFSGVNDAPEGGTYGWFTLSRSGPLHESLTVHYILDPSSTATEGVDYAPLSGSVTFQAQARDAGIAVNAYDLDLYRDQLVEGDETVRLTLTPSPYYRLAGSQTALLVIRDDEDLATGGPETTDNSYFVSHDRTLTIAPGGVLGNDAPNLGPVTAVFDRNPGHGALTLASDGSFVYTPDAHYAGPDSFYYRALATGADGLPVYSNPTLVQIEVTNQLPIVTVTATSGGTFVFTRTGGDQSQPLTVRFKVSGTADVGDDYARPSTPAKDASGNVIANTYDVTINGGSDSATFTVTPEQDMDVEGDETVVCSIEDTTDYDVGESSAQEITIRDDDFEVEITVVLVAQDSAHAASPGDPSSTTDTDEESWWSQLLDSADQLVQSDAFVFTNELMQRITGQRMIAQLVQQQVNEYQEHGILGQLLRIGSGEALFEPMVERGLTAYYLMRAADHSPAVSGVVGVAVPISDLVVVTAATNAWYGEELLSGQDLSGWERFDQAQLAAAQAVTLYAVVSYGVSMAGWTTAVEEGTATAGPRLVAQSADEMLETGAARVAPLSRPTLPAFSRTTGTQGVLRTPTGDIPLQSGVAGPAQSIPSGSSGFDIVTRTHVEGHAAAVMRQNGLENATVYINNPVVCDSCMNLLPRMLPNGSRLTVVLPDGTAVTFTGGASGVSAVLPGGTSVSFTVRAP